MRKLFRIAVRNLVRNRRRTLLTGSLMAVGIIAVVVFGAVAGGFKGMMIAQLTESVLGDLEVHRRGYVASIDNLPLTLNMPPQHVEAVARASDHARGRGVFAAHQVGRDVQQLSRNHQH